MCGAKAEGAAMKKLVLKLMLAALVLAVFILAAASCQAEDGGEDFLDKTVTVSGRVSYEDEGLSGVSVFVDGSFAAATDLDGHFLLNGIPCPSTLTFGKEGYDIPKYDVFGDAADIVIAATKSEEADDIKYTVTIAVPDGGKILFDGAEFCGEIELLASGALLAAEITLTAVPDLGYRFSHWTMSGAQVSENAEYTFIIVKNTEIAAYFEAEGVTEEPPEVVVQASGTRVIWQTPEGALGLTLYLDGQAYLGAASGFDIADYADCDGEHQVYLVVCGLLPSGAEYSITSNIVTIFYDRPLPPPLPLGLFIGDDGVYVYFFESASYAEISLIIDGEDYAIERDALISQDDGSFKFKIPGELLSAAGEHRISLKHVLESRESENSAEMTYCTYLDITQTFSLAVDGAFLSWDEIVGAVYSVSLNGIIIATDLTDNSFDISFFVVSGQTYTVKVTACKEYHYSLSATLTLTYPH
jgi:hypothetical protein